MGVLDGQSAIVTGAGQGIGRAIALRLAQDGADILVAELNEEKGAAVAGEVRALGRKGVFLRTDVGRAEDRQRMVDTALREFGKIDILVNNAGIIRIALPHEVTEEDWDLTLNINAKAVFFCCQAVLPHMRQRRSGRIINIASVAAKLQNPLCLPYNVSKAGVLAITRTLAQQYSREGLRVNAICPGIVDTALWQIIDTEGGARLGMEPGELLASRIKTIPVGRVEQPEDVARVAAFLAGPDSEYMTGQAIVVDGGLVMH